MRESTRTYDHWTTPAWFLDLVRQVGPIHMDPCSNEASSVGATVNVCAAQDGLSERWWTHLGYVGTTFVNPPYSRGQIGKWVDKMILEADLGCEIIALLPARVGSKWGQRVLQSADAVCFMAKRIRFDNPPPGQGNASPRFDSMVAYWGSRAGAFADAFFDHGVVFPWSNNVG